MPEKTMNDMHNLLNRVEDRNVGSFVPLTVLQNTLRAWPLMAIMIALGLLAGWLFHLRQPPVYEAVLELSVTIDLRKTGNLSQFEEDMALNAAGEVLVSNAVMQNVLEQAAAQGLPVDYQTLQQMTLAERMGTKWKIRLQNRDPALAQRLAALWGVAGKAALAQAYDHALQADALARSADELQSCLQKAVMINPSQPVCADWTIDQVQQASARVAQQLAAERAASQGLFVGMRLGSVEGPVVAALPVRYGTARVLAACGFIGFLLGMVLSQSSGLLRRSRPMVIE